MSSESVHSDSVLHVICDSDALWGPLALLRPAREKPLGRVRLLLMSSLFGLFYGMCANAVFALTHHFGGRAAPPVYAVPVFLMLAAFLCGELAVVRAWNRRARLLARRLEWAEKASVREP
jgi:hypothetical protein